jgi:hypothetical protein
MINRMIRLMWPKLTSAILLEVVKAVKPIVQQNLNAVSTRYLYTLGSNPAWVACCNGGCFLAYAPYAAKRSNPSCSRTSTR